MSGRKYFSSNSFCLFMSAFLGRLFRNYFKTIASKHCWFVCRHLIGFFLFLFLTIYTARKAPDLMELAPLQRLSDMIRRADLQKIHPELLNCLPSLSNISDIYRLKDEFKTSLPSIDFLYSVSGNVRELLTKCLPERFSHAYQTENSVQVLFCFLIMECNSACNIMQNCQSCFLISITMVFIFAKLSDTHTFLWNCINLFYIPPFHISLEE